MKECVERPTREVMQTLYDMLANIPRRALLTQTYPRLYVCAIELNNSLVSLDQVEPFINHCCFDPIHSPLNAQV